MPVFYSPTGNPEIWLERPAGYHTENEWYEIIYGAEAAREKIASRAEAELQTARASALSALRQKRLSVEYGGFSFNGQTWDSSEKDELRLNSMLKMFEITGATEFPGWKIAEGQYITATPEIIAGAAISLMRHYAAAFAAEASKAAEIAALGSVEEIEAWLAGNMKTGWPDEV